MNITPPKGRPMLYWVGKKPVESVKSYPTQLIEIYDPFNNTRFYEIPKYEDLEKDWHNLLFEGDNKEVLATLLELGFRGKIDLIYIDPPFASSRDYVRKVELRGFKGSSIEEDDAPLLQQVMYEDIWKRDEYFQWIYERLLLMKELLSETGSIYVHLDYRMVHYVKLIMDEVFGEENFRNEIIWRKLTAAKAQSKFFSNVKDNILFYSQSNDCAFNPQFTQSQADEKNYPYIEKGTGRRYGSFDLTQKGAGPPRYFGDKLLYPPSGKHWILSQEKINQAMAEGRIIFTSSGLPRIKRYLDEKRGNYLGDLWIDDEVKPLSSNDTERVGFETQKPEALLERVIKASTNEGDLVLDCFIGSGTTAAVAQKLGRRWIGVDINKGAIQLTAKRLRKIIEEQLRENGELFEKHNRKYFTFAVYKVNDYDLKLFQSEAKELAIKHLGIERTKTDPFFEGRLGNKLVKIIDFNHPLTLLDLGAIKDELSKRPDEERDIVIVCYGQELNTQAWIEDWNKRSPVNKIKVIDLRTDREKGGFIIHEPPQAKVEIKRTSEDTARVEIKEFISPTVIKRFNLEGSLLQKVIKDFRSMIDFVLIDPDYDGRTFKSVFVDIPEKKQDLIRGIYKIKIPAGKVKVAVEIVDVLGGELVVVEEV